MGNYSRYTMRVLDPNTLMESDAQDTLIAILRNANSEANYALDGRGNAYGDESKWYEYDSDLRKFSEGHPGFLFRIDRLTADGDYYRVYAMNGISKLEKGVVVYNAYDPTVFSGRYK